MGPPLDQLNNTCQFQTLQRAERDHGVFSLKSRFKSVFENKFFGKYLSFWFKKTDPSKKFQPISLFKIERLPPCCSLYPILLESLSADLEFVTVTQIMSVYNFTSLG